MVWALREAPLQVDAGLRFLRFYGTVMMALFLENSEVSPVTTLVAVALTVWPGGLTKKRAEVLTQEKLPDPGRVEADGCRAQKA